MFLYVSVILPTGEKVSVTETPLTEIPPPTKTPRHRLPRQTDKNPHTESPPQERDPLPVQLMAVTAAGDTHPTALADLGGGAPGACPPICLAS